MNNVDLNYVATMIENLRHGDDAYYTPETIDSIIAALREQATPASATVEERWDVTSLLRITKTAIEVCNELSRPAMAEDLESVQRYLASALAQQTQSLLSQESAAVSNAAQQPECGRREVIDIAESAARTLYSDYSGNHPTIHCNRFPAWEELSDKRRAEWLDKVVSADTGNREADNLIGRLMHADPTFSDCTDAAAFIRKYALAQPRTEQPIGTVLGGEFHYLTVAHGLPEGTKLYAAPPPRADAVDEAMVERAIKAFWPPYHEAQRKNLVIPGAFERGIRAALAAAINPEKEW